MTESHSPIAPVDSASQGNVHRTPVPDDGLVVSGYRDVQAVLSDKRFEVPAPNTHGPVGTVAWLRSSVARFANGDTHDTRLAVVLEELKRLEPDELWIAALKRTQATLESASPEARAEVMSSLAHRVPMEVMASALEFTDVTAAASAVVMVAGGYFPGSPPEKERDADDGVSSLLGICGAVDLECAVARLTIMVQACDATAALIEATLQVLEETDTAAAASWPTKALLLEVVRCCPPARFSRRVSREARPDWDVPAGGLVLCDVFAANRDPAAHDRPDDFDPSRKEQLSLTFGYGIRPCPAQAHALALAGGVVEALRNAVPA